MILDAQWLRRVRVLVLCLLLLITLPAKAQTTLFFPVIFKNGSMALKSTIRFVEPYESQNYALNPSGEIAGNFSNQGGGTVTRVTTFQKYGLYSYQVATTGNGDGGNFTLLALSAKSNYVSFRVKKPGATRLNVTIGSATKEAQLLETIDTEWSLYWAVFSSAQSSGQTNLRITQIGAGANTIYLDGLQVEPDKLTTYIDGTQEGCGWLGAPHASASTRSGDSRAGGVVQNFWEGYHFFPEKILGAGAAVEELNIDSYAFLPGGELNSSKIQPREFSLIGFFLGNTKEELHEKAQELELELGLNTYPGSQPVRLRYSGARVQKEIAARYAGGLEGDLPIYHNDDWSVEDERWVRNYKFKMRASIQFIATDPFWYEIGESATLLDTNDSADFSYIAGRLISTGQWSALGEPSAAGGVTINAVAEDDTYIYIGGSFVNFDGIAAADRIARYNKQTGVWSAMGSGLNGTVRDMAVGPDGNLYIIGQFTDAGGVAAADYFTMWDGSSYNALGTPASGITHTTTTVLKFDLLGRAFIGGSFLNWAGIAAADNIVMWDGSSYNAVGTGADTSVNAIDVYSDNRLLIGGTFSSFNGTAAENIVIWDGATATPLGTGTDALVNTVLITPGDIAYIGGAFTTADGLSSRLLVGHNGSTFFSLGSGLGGGTNINALAYSNGILYVGGNFTSAGDIDLADRMALWNGYTWAHLDIDLPGSPVVQDILISNIEIDPVIPKKRSIYVGSDADGTGNFAGLETVQNDGTIPAFPKIIFSRSGGTGATIQSLRNERTGRGLLFDYSLLNGESLTIDLNPKARTITSSFFVGSRLDARLKNDDFSVWQLLPGENQVTAFVSESGSPTVTAYLIYRTPFKSYN